MTLRRTQLTLLSLTALVAAGGAGALASGPALPEETVHGRVIDVTCPGPCSVDMEGRPFEGPADVVVNDRKTGDQVARVAAEKSRYTLLVPPGRYRIVAIPYPGQDYPCWQGTTRRLVVEAGQTSYRRLRVENVCVQ